MRKAKLEQVKIYCSNQLCTDVPKDFLPSFPRSGSSCLEAGSLQTCGHRRGLVLEALGETAPAPATCGGAGYPSAHFGRSCTPQPKVSHCLTSSFESTRACVLGRRDTQAFTRLLDGQRSSPLLPVHQSL